MIGAKPQTMPAIRTVQKLPSSHTRPAKAPATAARTGPRNGSHDGGFSFTLRRPRR